MPLVKADSDWLLRARLEGQFDLEHFLSENGADWYNVLLVAASDGHIDIIRSNLTAGMNVNHLLQLAARNGHIEIVHFLVDHGADANSNCKPYIQIIMSFY